VAPVAAWLPWLGGSRGSRRHPRDRRRSDYPEAQLSITGISPLALIIMPLSFPPRYYIPPRAATPKRGYPIIWTSESCLIRRAKVRREQQSTNNIQNIQAIEVKRSLGAAQGRTCHPARSTPPPLLPLPPHNLFCTPLLRELAADKECGHGEGLEVITLQSHVYFIAIQ